MPYSFQDFYDSLCYLGASGVHKTKKLIQIAEQDHFFLPIITTLHEQDLSVKHHYWGAPGCYIPKTTEVGTPSLHLSYRFGYTIAAHVFLHELVHIWQDHESRLPTPYSVMFGTHADMTADAIEQQLLACECEAALQAIAASWRLKQLGLLVPWRGALKHKDWRKLTRSYYGMRAAGFDEKDALERLEEQWHIGRYVRFYKRQAKNLMAMRDDSSSIAA